MIAQGEIYWVDFGDKYNSEFGKIRPALIIQSDTINALLDEMQYKSVAVIPLSTQLVKGAFFRVFVAPREALEKPSDIVCNWVCTVDFARIDTSVCLTRLEPMELESVKAKLAYLVE
ncbi:MAG: hypothetical protein KU37_02920 [Sulfuricurvum sp. PC08-66]|nr:MAG: hypothetical protein KU37_02920 [Sulfuricurvum sp. PC08-66]